ncbi:MAG: glycosyltransferase [Opitutaceae bacterium]|nr:glycosyltransferase [Opitutaceae bacterium]
MKPIPSGTMRSPLGTGFRWTGLFLSADVSDSMWIREHAEVHLPCALEHDNIVVDGELRPDGGAPEAAGRLGLELRVGGRTLATFFPPEGPFTWCVPLPPESRQAPVRLELRLLGAFASNMRAWLGRVFAQAAFARRWQPYRLQPLNKRLRIRRLGAGDETIADFNTSASAFDIRFITRHANIGINLVGWFQAALGVGESVRCAARAAAAAKIPHALVPLKLYCKAAQAEHAFDDRLQETNPYPVNVIHVDAPQTRDIDHHHGPAFSRGKHTVGYWAWELPEFPDGWVRYFAHVDEVWAPSRFAREAIAAKSPVPVFAMPHAIDFRVPPTAGARAALGLPEDRFLFLFVYDLNSYAERKNPRAVIRAYREAFGAQGRRDTGLVIKVHGVAGNERDLAALRAEIADLDGCTLLAETLPRPQVTLLQATCDAFVSLHRSEGFGLNVAECMFLGKPVVSTDWSATAEFVTADNGCPVRASIIELTENHGPYTKGQRWADPEIEHAAWHMRRLVEDRALRERLGAAAAATIRHEFSPERIGAMYAERLRAMALW